MTLIERLLFPLITSDVGEEWCKYNESTGMTNTLRKLGQLDITGRRGKKMRQKLSWRGGREREREV